MQKKMLSKLRAVTIRNVPPEVERAILARARERGISVNKAVVGMLKEQVGGRGEKKRYDDLDALAGIWTTQETEDFDQALREQRRPDPEIWKE